MEYSKGAHTVYYTRYHVVFVTKYRRKVLKHGMGSYAIKTLRAVCRIYPELVIHEAKCDEDHIHFLITIPPAMPVSHAVNLLKTNSARAMRRRFPLIKNMYYTDDVMFWSPGYFVSTVGADEQVIKNYIKHQGQEDSGQAKLVL